jgi:predicted secreted protein
MSKKRFVPILPKETYMSDVEKTPDTIEASGVQEQVASAEAAIEVVEQRPVNTPEPEVAKPAIIEQAIVVEKAPEPVATSAQTGPAYSSNLTQMLEHVKQTNNPAVINYVNELLDYSVKMAPSQTMTREQGAVNQAALFNTIISIIDHSGKDFRIAYSAMLSIFNEYKKGAFNGAYVLRFMEEVSLNKNKRTAFIKLINLISMTADSKTRKEALKHIDLKRELVGSISDEGKMRITAFYMA